MGIITKASYEQDAKMFVLECQVLFPLKFSFTPCLVLAYSYITWKNRKEITQQKLKICSGLFKTSVEDLFSGNLQSRNTIDR